MRAVKIAVTSESFSFHPILKEQLALAFPNSKFRKDKGKLSKEELITYLQDCDGAIVGLDPIDEETLNRLPKLKIISKYGVGLDNLDLDALSRKNIKLGWAAGVNKEAVSELAIAQMINLSRNISSTSALLKGGQWMKDGGRELSELTVGIIGVGHVGKEIIRKLYAFGPRILACDIINQKEFLDPFKISQVPHEKIYQECDIITLHIPLNTTTKDMIDERVLRLMKPGAILINTARGGIVDEEALYYALKNGHLHGAAMDVFVGEPAVKHKLHNLNNFWPTPHISGNSNRAILQMGISAINHLISFFPESDK